MGIGIGIGGTRGVGLSAPVPASVPAPYGAIGIGVEIGIVGDCGVGSSVPAANESNGIASQMTPFPNSVPASVPIENETNGMLSPMTPSLVYKPILSYFFISPISILETLSSNFSTGVIFSLVK